MFPSVTEPWLPIPLSFTTGRYFMYHLKISRLDALPNFILWMTSCASRRCPWFFLPALSTYVLLCLCLSLYLSDYLSLCESIFFSVSLIFLTLSFSRSVISLIIFLPLQFQVLRQNACSSGSKSATTVHIYYIDKNNLSLKKSRYIENHFSPEMTFQYSK